MCLLSNLNWVLKIDLYCELGWVYNFFNSFLRWEATETQMGTQKMELIQQQNHFSSSNISVCDLIEIITIGTKLKFLEQGLNQKI